MGGFGRAIGFMVGGTLQGAGTGILKNVEEDWNRMREEMRAARDDARQAQNQSFTAGQNELTRKQDAAQFTSKLDLDKTQGERADKLKDKELGVRSAEATATRESNDLYRRDSLAETKRHNDEQIKILTASANARDKANEVEAIARAQKDAELDLVADSEEEIKSKHASIANSLMVVDQDLGKRYAKQFRVELPKEAAPAPAAPPTPGQQPPKPESYPDAVWVDDGKTKGWVVKRNGKSYVVD